MSTFEMYVPLSNQLSSRNSLPDSSELHTLTLEAIAVANKYITKAL